MLFGEKLKQLRLAAGMTQEAVAKDLGVTCRAFQNYESGRVYPKNTDIYGKIAKLFDVSADFLLSDEDHYVMDAHSKGGTQSMKDVQALIAEVGGLFAGGELSEEDKDKVLRTITELYWQAKENNKKYTPKQYKQEAVE
ncbi:MAG: helix-turn-helix domain-containing protein [Peptococcaceae bacterium]|nr:helix-turn-helix domain-containing protein [Peptococcaceae bacterium]